MLNFSPEVFLVIFVSAASAYFFRKLSFYGAVMAFFVAGSVYVGFSFLGLALLGSFFLMGIAATSWKKQRKINFQVQKSDDSRRKAGQVLANGGFAALAGLTSFWYPEYYSFLEVMIAGSFSTATADTLSSELGNVYGSRFVNILTFREDKKGLDGVISLEGTVAGLAGSFIISIIYVILNPNFHSIVPVILAGLLGNIVDSVAGATLERNGVLTNNWVNFLNTVAGAIFALILSLLFK